MRDPAREAAFWRLLVRVRGLRVRRKLRALADARRHERHAADAFAARLAALEQHARQRQRVLTFCRRNGRVGAQWRATLRAHDARLAGLQLQLSEARDAHAAARAEAGFALRAWQVEQGRHDDAKERVRLASARHLAIDGENA
ncbi:hypothetical protein [Paraburkholderia sp. BL21I4N1]|uniref:hypothetical protein n=1 Tax=Paraburkholderia sp. BL21I4N1 TaxID=1938801 RepID=UPI000D4522F6|nr:hypothetical protein [Paraburkholderia sp. BL21I4N1]PQV44265.1 hypothetical protein B0G83_12514 [Paraburkholderia sp. BL21I4N1]